MSKRISGSGIRKEKEMYIRYIRTHHDTRQKGRKLKRLRASLYAKMDMRLARLRSGLNEDRKSTRLNSSHSQQSRMPSSA